jgi:hypothetical protein
VTNPPYDPDPAKSTDPYTTGASTTSDYSTGGYVGITEPASTGSPSTTDVAKGQAAGVKDTAVDAGKNVASTAKDEASNVVAEAGSQARSLLGNVLGEVRGQVNTQQQRLAEGVHALAAELGSMASKSEQSGPITDLAHQASKKVGEVGHWLENREPADILDDLRSFARRRSGAFLGLSALAGVVVGRLTRGAVAANTSVDSPSSKSSSIGTASTYSTTPATGYDTYTSSTYGTADASTYDTAGAPRSMVEELPATNVSSVASDRGDYAPDYLDSGRGDVTR